MAWNKLSSLKKLFYYLKVGFFYAFLFYFWPKTFCGSFDPDYLHYLHLGLKVSLALHLLLLEVSLTPLGGIVHSLWLLASSFGSISLTLPKAAHNFLRHCTNCSCAGPYFVGSLSTRPRASRLLSTTTSLLLFSLLCLCMLVKQERVEGALGFNL